MTFVQRLELGLRVTLELGIVAALAYWGAGVGGTTTEKVVVAIAAPGAAFAVWGLVDFREAGRLAEPLRLLEELVISFAAAVAWYSAGVHLLAFALIVVSVGYHALVYAAGHRLLGPKPAGLAARADGMRGEIER